MENLKAFVVFFQGVISFFSPCVLPLIPVYLGILSSSNKGLGDENIKFRNTSLFKNTVLFVLGISTVFFILGSSANLLNKALASNKDIFTFVGGIFIIIMGLFYIGAFKFSFLQKEKKINMEVREMKGLTAYFLGFTFSFGWTPCVGPILASVLVMASSSDSSFTGNILILVYTLGFIIPFILIAMFYKKLTNVLNFIKKNINKIKILGGAILIGVGLFMAIPNTDSVLERFYEKDKVENKTEQKVESTPSDESSEEDMTAPDFEAIDQYGVKHKLSDYKGKVVFLNFWATWCGPCKVEMPELEKVYKHYGENKGDVIVLGVAAPELDKEKDENYIKEFLKDNSYTFPVVFDTKENEYEISLMYYINAYPTTFIIDKEGNIKVYQPGAMDEDTMKYLIDSAK